MQLASTARSYCDRDDAVQAQADAEDATALHMQQLQDHFQATAADNPDAAIETLVLVALAHTCWEAGILRSKEAVDAETRRRLAVQPGALLRALAQVICVRSRVHGRVCYSCLGLGSRLVASHERRTI